MQSFLHLFIGNEAPCKVRVYMHPHLYIYIFFYFCNSFYFRLKITSFLSPEHVGVGRDRTEPNACESLNSLSLSQRVLSSSPVVQGACWPMRRSRHRHQCRWDASICFLAFVAPVSAKTHTHLPAAASASQGTFMETSGSLIWVCHIDTEQCVGIRSPFNTYSRRSVWFQRKAIIITAIFLALLIILIIGLAVFLRDIGVGARYDDSDDETLDLDDEENEDHWGSHSRMSQRIRHPHKLFRRRLRRRARVSNRAHRHLRPSRHASEMQVDVSALDPPIPHAMHLTLPVPQEHVSDTTASPQSALADSSRTRTPSSVRSPSRYPRTSTNIDQTDIDAVDALPMDPFATVPPCYGTVNVREQRMREKLHPMQSLSESSSSSRIHDQCVESAPETSALCAHISTDEKSTLEALYNASSAPALNLTTNNEALAPPTAPEWTDPQDNSHVQQGSSRRNMLPGPPVSFESRYDLYAPSASDTKAQEAEAERAGLATLLPSMPGLHPTDASYLPVTYLPQYDQHASNERDVADLELGLRAPSPANTEDDMLPLPSAPIMHDV